MYLRILFDTYSFKLDGSLAYNNHQDLTESEFELLKK